MNALIEARRLLCQLGLGGRRFTGDLFLERLDSHLGIAVAAIPDPRLPAGGISGARITTGGSHIVFYPASASERLQLAVICHECAHLLLGHCSRSVDEVLATSEFPAAQDELAAEAFGAALVQFARRPDRLRMLVEGSAHRTRQTAPASVRSRLKSFYESGNREG